jgi:hypothetical protein
MIRVRWLAVFMVGLLTAWARAEPPLDCSKAALRKARSVANQAARRTDYKAAIATLAPFRTTCDEADPVEHGWLLSDLAVDYLKDGQPVECKKLVDDALYPKSAVAQAGNDKLMSALAHNGELCGKALVAQYGPFDTTPCPFAIADAAKNDTGGMAATALPATLWPKGAEAACLAVVSRQDSDKVVCPRLSLVVKAKDGKLTRRALKTNKSGLTAEMFCCGYDTVAVGIKDGTPMVRLGADTPVRECSGGTAHASLDEVLAWKGDILTVVLDASQMVE